MSDIYRIELRAASINELRSFIDGANLDLGCRPAARREGADFVVEAYAAEEHVNALRALRPLSVAVTIIENATQAARATQADLRAQFTLVPGQVPKGFGIKE
jgi:hypothetical protein